MFNSLSCGRTDFGDNFFLGLRIHFNTMKVFLSIAIAKDGGQNHAMNWGKTDNTYRKNNNKSTWWAKKATNCWAKKGNQRNKTKHRAYWKPFRWQGSTRGREFRTHAESCIGNVWLFNWPRRPIETKQFKSRWHQRETKWNMGRLRKEAAYTF